MADGNEKSKFFIDDSNHKDDAIGKSGRFSRKPGSGDERIEIPPNPEIVGTVETTLSDVIHTLSVEELETLLRSVQKG
jgi:hypothetical protein